MMGGHQTSLFEYRSRSYPSNLLNSYIPDLKLRAAADRISGTQFVPFQDLDALHVFLPLSMRFRFPMTVVFARDFRAQPGYGNLILLGHKRQNPWVEHYEAKLSFRYDYIRHGNGFRGLLINEHPRAGEQSTYVAEY